MLGCTVTTDDAAERSALQLLKYTHIHKQRKIAETNPMIENNLKFFYERQNAETLLPFFSFVPFFPSLSLFVAHILHILQNIRTHAHIIIVSVNFSEGYVVPIKPNQKNHFPYQVKNLDRDHEGLVFIFWEQV